MTSLKKAVITSVFLVSLGVVLIVIFDFSSDNMQKYRMVREQQAADLYGVGNDNLGANIGAVLSADRNSKETHDETSVMTEPDAISSECGDDFPLATFTDLPNGWTRRALPSFCLSVDIPDGWYVTTSGWPRIEPVAPGAIQIGLDPDEWMRVYPASMYSVGMDDELADVGMTAREIHLNEESIGNEEIEIYDIGGVRKVDGNGAMVVEHSYVLYASHVERAYVVKASYIEEIRFRGQEIMPFLLQILKTTRAY